MDDKGASWFTYGRYTEYKERWAHCCTPENDVRIYDRDIDEPIMDFTGRLLMKLGLEHEKDNFDFWKNNCIYLYNKNSPPITLEHDDEITISSDEIRNSNTWRIWTEEDVKNDGKEMHA